jgi:hypothetical protein
MDWGIAQTILTVVFGVTAIISIVVAIRLARRKKPSWAYDTSQIIGLGTNAPPELKLTFDNFVVPDVYRTMLIFYNRGNETIRKSDVNEAVTIKLKNGKLLRDPNLQAVSRAQIRLSAIRRGDELAEIDFSYLDQGDGGVIELLHTKYDEIDCDGDIMGAGKPVKLGKFYYQSPRYKIPKILVYTIMLGMPLALIVAILAASSWSAKIEDWVYIGLVVLIWPAQFIVRMWPDYRYLKFPKWSREQSST